MTRDAIPTGGALRRATAPEARPVLVIGATGTFGQRLARHLSRNPRVRLLVGIRCADRGWELANRLVHDAVVPPEVVQVDTTDRLEATLAQLRPWCVIDCTGPFQESDHSLPRAALRAGAHVIDIADAPSYLCEFEKALDPLAKHQDLVAIGGASSTPCLSGAAVAALASSLHEIHDIEMVIAPGGRGDVGPAVIDAILGYAGKPVPAWLGGKLAYLIGWRGAITRHIDGLGRRRCVPVQSFDPEYLGPNFGVRGSVVFRAALESLPEQVGLEVLAAARSLWPGWDLRLLAPLLTRLRQITKLGTSDVGAMEVRVRGVDFDRRETEATWRLLARRGDGPVVPILPAAAAVQSLLEQRIGAGATLATRALSLDEIVAQMSAYAITTRIEVHSGAKPSMPSDSETPARARHAELA
ncbi:MAG: saccharopine dehydrogenase NADP-binding domain-containing protein [Pseudomonadota bacterium]